MNHYFVRDPQASELCSSYDEFCDLVKQFFPELHDIIVQETTIVSPFLTHGKLRFSCYEEWANRVDEHIYLLDNIPTETPAFRKLALTANYAMKHGDVYGYFLFGGENHPIDGYDF